MHPEANQSTLAALAEIHRLEAERAAQDERRRQARVLAETRVLEAAERRQKLEGAREARMEAARQARRAQEAEVAAREERFRQEAAELRARADAEVEARREQLRLEAQLAKRTARRGPIALYAVITALLLGVAVGAAAAARDAQQSARLASAAATAAEARATADQEVYAAIGVEIEGLRARQATLGAQLDADRRREVSAPVAPASAPEATKSPIRTPRVRAPAVHEEPQLPAAGTREKIEIRATDDPLEGIR